MQFSCNEECKPNFVTKFGCKLNIKSIQKDECLVRCFALYSLVAIRIEKLCHRFLIVCMILCQFYNKIFTWHYNHQEQQSTRFFRNVSEPSCDWLGELYKMINLNDFPPILNPKLMHPYNYRNYLQWKKIFILDRIPYPYV